MDREGDLQVTVGELIELLERGVRSGRLHELGSVKIRDLSVSEEAMEAGSSGYVELAEVLMVEDSAYLLPETW